MKKPFKPFTKRIAKSRKGAPPISLQTIVDRAKTSAFIDEMLKVANAVSDEEALEAARLLTKKRGIRQHAESGAVFSALAPAAQTLGRGVKAFVDAKRGRFGAARRAFKDTTKGDIAQNMATGFIGGAVLSAAREGLQLQRAKDTYARYMKQHGLHHRLHHGG